MRKLLVLAGLDGAVTVDSAGTGGWHVGEQPDPRSCSTAARRGIVLDHQAWQFTARDFARFDLVLAMDRENLRRLENIAPDATARGKMRLLRSFDPTAPPGAEVPDPYYGGQRGFDDVVDICERACEGVIAHVRTLVSDAR
jgi:protein-tyrosine phosphatase